MRTKPYQPKNIDDFWKSRIDGWLIKGINTCVDNNANIGAATLIFCYIELFGSMTCHNPNATSRNRFYSFCERYLSKINNNYEKYKQKLYEDFRCGLAHEAIMKKGTGIFRSDDPGDNGYTNFCSADNALFLDLIALQKDLLIAVMRLKQDIDIDPDLRENTLKRLRQLKWELPDEK